ncbi:hypothetical protein Pla110_18220 [Polystyrenella longa]|uniref:tRNA(Glu)-specific nuclease WapA n=2 Tax=Polystyrenella longa TaxID=2528007 RepID=A0A518CLJ2_9PLAN|nr:hypothetical protein Pla110_18220 [Polystyrenella longa]
MNHTGYSQVIEEVTVDNLNSMSETERVIYTLGLDVLQQVKYDSANPTGLNSIMLHDGHGSVRMLTDMLAAVTIYNSIPQIFAYDAYGIAIGFSEANAITSLLYSGEQYDTRIQQQYLRARYYNALTGGFNRVDPFFGNLDDPQSLHKYLYTHGDPVNGIDPTGMFSVTGMLATTGIMTAVIALPGPGDWIQESYKAVLEGYAVNLQWDIEWAADFSLPDSWGSRNDNTWVKAALLWGVYGAYGISIPFTNIEINPLDIFLDFDDPNELTYEEFYGDDPVEDAPGPMMMGTSAAMSGAIGRGSVVNLSRGMKAKFSRIQSVKVDGVEFRVSRFKHWKIRDDIAIFSRSTKPKALQDRIKVTDYARPPAGRSWESLSKDDKLDMRRHDFIEVSEELERKGISHSRDNGTVKIDGVKYTIHHHNKKGQFELIKSEVHRAVKNHVGMALWHRSWD